MAILTVPTDFNSLQAAILNAASGDEIRVTRWSGAETAQTVYVTEDALTISVERIGATNQYTFNATSAMTTLNLQHVPRGPIDGTTLATVRDAAGDNTYTIQNAGFGLGTFVSILDRLGNDSYFGDAGSQSLFLQYGENTAQLGGGDDSVSISRDAGNSTVHGGDGFDRITLSATTGLDIDLGDPTPQLLPNAQRL